MTRRELIFQGRARPLHGRGYFRFEQRLLGLGLGGSQIRVEVECQKRTEARVQGFEDDFSPEHHQPFGNEETSQWQAKDLHYEPSF